MADFGTLEQMFSMLAPADLLGKAKLNLGGPLEEFNGPLKAIAGILDNDGRGVLSTKNVIERLNTLVEKTDTTAIKEELKFLFTCYSSQGKLTFASDDAMAYMSKDGPQNIVGVAEIIGKEFTLPTGVDVLLMSSRTPFFHPSKRHTKKIELFLNSMPSTVISQLTPLLDVEFQIQKYPVDGLPFLNQLRFLLGDSPEPKDGPNKAILAGQRLLKGADAKDQRELDFSGMEMFTSPQTLVNPTPNIDSTGRQRYSEILDPFRPFASIESFTVTSRPSVGMMSFKTAQLVIKLHDRSRLAEISDLIRPQSYGNVTVWTTYGWRGPDYVGNPYFEFINNNMLMREAYGVSNASFSFDQVGQVTLNLELFTKGSEVKSIPITHALDTKGKDTAVSTIRKVKELAAEISRYRKILKLDPPEGINKEIRAFQILDSAEVGEFPNFKASEVEAAITQLRASFSKSKGIDTDSANKLINAMKSLYEKDAKDKFSLKERISTLSTKEIAKKFDEVVTGPDPYLIDDSKKVTKDQSPLYNEIKKYESAPKSKTVKYRKRVVSFGKLFSTFGLTCILGADVAEEVQVFFYGFNEQCGPISGHSIAEFPIDMSSFVDQYTDYVMRKGGENITLDEFMGLVVNAQILDNRAIGYGLRSFYKPYDPKNKEAQIEKDQEQNFESALSSMTAQYGAFKKPVVEMYVETTHERVSEVGESDILAKLSYSAKDFSPTSAAEAKSMNARRIMRIHIYDKQLNPHKEAGALLKSFDGSGFIEVPSTDYVKKIIKDVQLTDLQGSLKVLDGVLQDALTGKIKLTEFTNARQVKDLVSKLVPTITYGANGTTISNASLSTKAESLLSTVNMLRANTTKNTSQPNGSGEGGIPLRVIPAQLTMTSMGCCLATMAQVFFIDFNTGTSIDNLYICTGLTHTLTPGKFETGWTFGFSDAYGVFEGAPNIVKQLSSLTTF